MRNGFGISVPSTMGGRLVAAGAVGTGSGQGLEAELVLLPPLVAAAAEVVLAAAEVVAAEVVLAAAEVAGTGVEVSPQAANNKVAINIRANHKARRKGAVVFKSLSFLIYPISRFSITMSKRLCLALKL